MQVSALPFSVVDIVSLSDIVSDFLQVSATANGATWLVVDVSCFVCLFYRRHFHDLFLLTSLFYRRPGVDGNTDTACLIVGVLSSVRRSFHFLALPCTCPSAIRGRSPFVLSAAQVCGGGNANAGLEIFNQLRNEIDRVDKVMRSQRKDVVNTNARLKAGW